MPIPMTPGDGAAPAPAPEPPVRPAPQPPQADARPALATVLPAWDLVPPSHVLAFRRRA